MNLPAFDTDLRFEQVFVNATAVRTLACRPTVNIARCEMQLPLTAPVPAGSRSRSAVQRRAFATMN
jgi:hypothetical protein